MIFFQAHRIAQAIQHDNMADLQKLLAKGADPNACEEYGRMPLERAVLRGNLPAAQMLIDAGASREMAYESGTLLHVAAAHGDVDMARLLLERFAGIAEEMDGTRNTPLHLAALAGHAEMVTFLIDAGFDPARKNADNRTALYLAQKKSHPDVIEILEAYHQKNPLPKPALPRQIEQAAETLQPEQAGWHKLSDERIAHVIFDAAIGYRTTEIFNFAARERTRLYQNLDTRIETAETQAFDDLTEKSPLEDALSRLRDMGGTADEGAVYGRSLGKPAPRREP
ncbi:MAG: ankyrin repeat domain-containing protein [Alphaproteobacteria bacterium]|nr:ankyrin repeat domain-containing protein [Alphaproteobacteria bacterium]